MEGRVIAALLLIGICVAGGLIAWAAILPRRRREKLRRRGIKNFGH